MIVESIKYIDPLGAKRYLTTMAIEIDNGFSLLIFDPGPPGTEKIAEEQVSKISRFISRHYHSKIKEAKILLTHTHPTAAGSAYSLYEMLRKRYPTEVYSHIRSLPLIERGKSPEYLASHRFERNTSKRLWLFKEHSPIIYRPYYIRILSRYKPPKITKPLVPNVWDPEKALGDRIEIDAEYKLQRMRSAGHSYEHVVYRIEHEDFRGLYLGDEGPISFGFTHLRYNDATSWQYNIPLLEERHEKIFERDSSRVFWTHGARRISRSIRLGRIDSYQNLLKETVSEGFKEIDEIMRMRISDAAAAMIMRDIISKRRHKERKEDNIGSTQYLNAENLPVFTTRSALVYLNDKVVEEIKGGKKVVHTRAIDMLGKFWYIEIVSPSRSSAGTRSHERLGFSS